MAEKMKVLNGSSSRFITEERAYDEKRSVRSKTR